MTIRASRQTGPADIELELQRAVLLPGRVAAGHLGLAFRDDVESRGILSTLIATERWQYHDRERDASGNWRTVTRTASNELRRLPVQLSGPARFTRGERRDLPFEVPVPPLGPATFEGTVSRLTWELEAKVDIPGGLDAAIVMDVRVAQPAGLILAGALGVGQFALWPSADAAADGARASIALDPSPLCVGEPFSGGLAIGTEGAERLQEIRLELRVNARATVASGLEEEVTLWAARIAGEGEFVGDERVIPFEGALPDAALPTVRLPHGRSDAAFHVILARPWAPDTHLVRDVAICSTREL